MIKKLLATALVIGLIITGFHYYQFKQRSARLPKNILVVAQNISTNAIKSNLAQQAMHSLQKNENIHATLVDIADLNLPFIQSEHSPVEKPVEGEEVEKWNHLISSADGIIFILSDINNGYSGYFKNTFDLVWKSWHNKPIGAIVYSRVNSQDLFMIPALTELFHTVKADPITPLIFINDDQVKMIEQNSDATQIEPELDNLAKQIYINASNPSYSKYVYRSIGDRIKRRFIKLFKPKK